MTFACETCGTPVTVPVRRNHRFCSACAAARAKSNRRAEFNRRDATKAAVRAGDDEASREVEQLLGVPSSSAGTRCVGCGKPLKLRAYRGGLKQKWCSNGCRQRIAVRGIGAGGYAGALVNDPCVYCGSEGGTIDHVSASSQGGGNDWANLAGSCQACNSRKGGLPLLRFMLAKQLYEQLDAVKAELATLGRAA